MVSATPFRTLAEISENIMGTTKRLEKMDIGGSFLAKLASEELEAGALLLIGRPFPRTSQRTLALDWKALNQILQELLQPSPELLRELFVQSGDIGEVVHTLSDEGRVEQLAMLVEAIHNAMTHRIAKAYPDIPIRDMAIDFHGGMNQILHSADAVMKCGLGIFRKHVLKGKQENERDIVGVPTQVSFKAGARCYSLEFGTEDKAQLAFFEVDVIRFIGGIVVGTGVGIGIGRRSK